LVGLEREAAKEAFGQFLAGGTATPNQIEFVNLIIDHLTQHGVMTPARLYESPFTDINPRGPEGVFPTADVELLINVLARIRAAAA
jgi:type I restriction enzyme R subunit